MKEAGTVTQELACEMSSDDAVTMKYATDASIFSVKPKVIAFPKNTSELKNLVKDVHTSTIEGEPWALTARNRGTCMSGGSLSESIIVDMNDGFSWIDAVDTDAKTVWVGSGTMYKDIEVKTLEKGLLFAPYPSSKDTCGIGGMLGNNASGEKSVRYGATVDNVAAVRIVCADGNEYEFGSMNPGEVEQKCLQKDFEGYIYREITQLIDANWKLIQESRPNVRKNAAGYAIWKVWNRDHTELNLAKLIIGSQGTLGIITAAKLKLIDNLKHARMIVIPINNLSQLAGCVKEILSHQPEGVEVYGHHTYELAKQWLPEVAAAAKSAEGQTMIVFAQFADNSKEQSDHNATVCIEALKRSEFLPLYIEDEAEREAHWTIRRQSFALLKNHPYQNTRAVPFIEDTIVPIDHYGEFLAALEAILSEYDMTYTFAGHIADGSIRLVPLVDMEAPDAAEKVFELAERVYDLVFAFGGSMSVDHNDGIIRTPYLRRMYNKEIISVFYYLKRVFDPMNIFNPGKKTDLSLEFAKAHMIRTNTVS